MTAMAVDADSSHPLLRKLSGEWQRLLSCPLLVASLSLAGVLHRLKTTAQPVRDGHYHLIPFCETLELVFRHGLKRNQELCAASLVCM